MRSFLVFCIPLLITACSGSLSDGSNDSKSADPASAASQASPAGSSGSSGSAGDTATSGTTTELSRGRGQAGASSGSAGQDTTPTGGTGGDTPPSTDGKQGSAGAPPDPTTLPDPVKDPDGFTTLTKSADTQIIYVSSSGDDNNDGLSEDKPLKTAAAGIRKLRDGYPDWVLFKRGDTFTGGLGDWPRLSGRAVTEPMVVSAYGDGARPLFRTGGEMALNSIADSRGGPQHDHVWFIGLSFIANTRDPSDPSFDSAGSGGEGIHWRTGTTDLLIEDCVVRFYSLAGSFQDSGDLGISGVRLRRNQFLDSFSFSSGPHSEGLYIADVEGMLFEENIFDHNGWNEDVPGATKEVFNHNLYIDNGNTGIVAKNNIFLRASSHGLMMRPGGIADGNLFVYNAISLLVGGGDNPEPGGVDGEAINNVVLLGADIGSTVKEYGIDLQNIHAVTVSNNVVANALSAQANSPLPMGVSGVAYTDNIVYNWPLGKSTSGSYLEPTRDLASYDAMLGGPGTLDHFIEGLRSQSQQSWRTEYMAQTINEYIRAGFTP